MLWVYITSPTLWHSYDSAIPSGYAALRIYIQVPFPYQVIPSQRQQLATALSSMGVPLASSILGYPFRRQPDWLPIIVPHTHTGAVGANVLCW